jgi:membrane fusion protein, multidrug efflux system
MLSACHRPPRDVPPLVTTVSQAIAQTEATANVEVRARVEATVEKILFVEGTSVQEGDPLFLLDKKPIEQRLAAAKGNLGQLEANLGRVTQDVERLRPLAGRGAVSKADLDTAVANQKQAEAAWKPGGRRSGRPSSISATPRWRHRCPE